MIAGELYALRQGATSPGTVAADSASASDESSDQVTRILKMRTASKVLAESGRKPTTNQTRSLIGASGENGRDDQGSAWCQGLSRAGLFQEKLPGDLA